MIIHKEKTYRIADAIFTYEDMECIDGLMRGKTTAAIAAGLGWSDERVKGVLFDIKKKLGTSTDDKLADWLIEEGFLSLGFRSQIWGYQPLAVDGNKVIFEYR